MNGFVKHTKINIGKKPKYIMLFALTVDIVLILLSFYISSLIRFDDGVPNILYYGLLLFMMILVWIFISIKYELYEIPAIVYADKIMSNNLRAASIYTLIISALMYFLFEYNISRLFFIYVVSSFIFLLLLWRLILIQIIKLYRRKGNYRKKIILVGFNENSERIIQIISKPESGFKLLGVFDDTIQNNSNSFNYLGKIDDVKHFCSREVVECILISLSKDRLKIIKDLMRFGENNMIRVDFAPEWNDFFSKSYFIDYIGDVPVAKLRQEPMQNLTNKMIKRGFDLFFSWSVILFIFTWLFPIISILIVTTSRGPIFFKQLRTGRDGKAFTCYKFRTMKVNGSSDTLQACKNDSRITSIGKFLRKSSLDELPQFFNVILKQMSVVGPRPHMITHTENYRILVDKFMVRHYAKPGITGWAQINGFRGETKELNDMYNRVRADVWYLENWSFFLDIKIIILTFWRVLIVGDKNAF